MAGYGILAVIALLLPVDHSGAKERKASTYTFAQIVGHPDNFADCRTNPGPGSNVEKIRHIDFTITKTGIAKDVSAGDSAPEWVQVLAECAIKKLAFSPATRNEIKFEQEATLALRLRKSDSSQGGEIQVDKLESLITAPRMRLTKSIDSCILPGMWQTLDRFVLSLTVLPDGSTTGLRMPVGSEPQLEKVATCILNRAEFLPGSRNGVAVEATATLPIAMMAYAETVGDPAPNSSAVELEAAYRACYPPDLVTMASAFYRFDVAKNGRLENPKLVKSSGDPRLDEAGICILSMLKFTPMKQDGLAIRSTVTWELPMRPPR